MRFGKVQLAATNSSLGQSLDTALADPGKHSCMIPEQPSDSSNVGDPGFLSSPLRNVLVSEAELHLQREFFPLGYSVLFLTNDPAVLAAAEASFGHTQRTHCDSHLTIRVCVTRRQRDLCPPEPARHQLENLFSLVADADNRAILDLITGANFTWLTSAAAENQLYLRTQFLEKVVYLLLGSTVVTDLHAACVSRNGKGILLCGESGAGKSTLAYACARSGWTYISDDTSYLVNDAKIPRVIGHCHRARFRPLARSLFPELADFAITPRLEGKPSIEVLARNLPIAHAEPEAAIDSIVILNRRSGATGTLIRLPDGSATQHFIQGLYSSGEICLRHKRILQRLWYVPTHELHYHNLYDGIRALEGLTMSW
jgi:hypothetical protein